jgi:hypothetical protein
VVTIMFMTDIGCATVTIIIYVANRALIMRRFRAQRVCDNPLHRAQAQPRAALESTGNVLEALSAAAGFATGIALFGLGVPGGGLIGGVIVALIGYVLVFRWKRRREHELDLTQERHP